MLLLCPFLFMFIHLLFIQVASNRSITDNASKYILLLDENNAIKNGHVIKKVDEMLNLTCQLNWPYTDYNVTWQLPKESNSNSKARISPKGYSSSNLLIKRLQESDSGDYKCNAINLFKNVVIPYTIPVFVEKRILCSNGFYPCPSSYMQSKPRCIKMRFVCDGYPDCMDGEDESEKECGTNPCQNKVMCENRCIPKSWCCQPQTDVNCTIKVKLACCQQLVNSQPAADHENELGMDQRRYKDIDFLQTTIYTVIGSALTFMVVVTILIVIVCRFHMKRGLFARYPSGNLEFGNNYTTRPSNFNNINSEHNYSLTDLDLYFNHSPGYSVTYNIDSGVQFVGRPVDPPPYCEVVSIPPKDGPPPIYVSRENLENEALLLKPASYSDSTSGMEDPPPCLENANLLVQASHCSSGTSTNI